MPTQGVNPKEQLAQKAIITDGDKVLLIQKGPDDPLNPGKWEFPGGRVEKGEEPREALEREVKEEVGLKIEVHPGPPLAVWSWRLGEGPDAPTVVAEARRCYVVGQDPISLEDGIRSYKWVEMSEVPKYPLMPNARKAIISSLRTIAGSPKGE
jgi:8-oxo-dGTP pyrophosphatase MutT (NUDIX family)